MIITYANGETTEAILLSRTEEMMRVALKGSDDVTGVANVNGTWISEDLEPVQVRYEWQRQTRKALVSVADCVCSRELAARLIHLLWVGDEAELHIVGPIQENSHDFPPYLPAA